MSLEAKKRLLIVLSLLFVGSLIYVQRMEVIRRAEEAGLSTHRIAVPATSKECASCHLQSNPGIVEQWKGSPHAKKGVGCYDCHKAEDGEPDAFTHYGQRIATVVTPRDCGQCHVDVQKEFAGSHHANGGNILASLDNYLAETVEGAREPFNPHSPTPGMEVTAVNGLASAFSGCQQCHGSKVALQSTDGSQITVDTLKPNAEGKPTNVEAMAKIKKDKNGRPLFDPSTWPNTGIGRLNLDGSKGSCSACHSRHDFSPRRARQPENCGKCHLGPDHPQKEIYEESKHGVAYRDLRDEMNLNNDTWILGKDYSQAPTCATCHMSANSRDPKITHDPRTRISWSNRPPVSARLDTDLNGKIVKTMDPTERAKLVVDSASNKRDRMRSVCEHCHTPDYVSAFYKQYDDFVILYNEKFAKPGQAIMGALYREGLITKKKFDEKIEWTWFYLWHHEGRRARHGASMMAPDYAHWHGMYEVAERFYQELIPEAREILEHAKEAGNAPGANSVEEVIEGILDRPEHRWIRPEPESKGG